MFDFIEASDFHIEHLRNRNQQIIILAFRLDICEALLLKIPFQMIFKIPDIRLDK